MHFIKNCPKWPGWPHGFTKKGCTLCCYIKGRIWFIDRAASHMIGWVWKSEGDFSVFIRPLTAGPLLGVPSLFSADTTTAEKKKPRCLFFLSESSDHGYFWLSCTTVSCSLTHLCQQTHAKGALGESLTCLSSNSKRLISSFAWNEVNAEYSFPFPY